MDKDSRECGPQDGSDGDNNAVSMSPDAEADSKAVVNVKAMENCMSVAELIAKARAPVKHEFLCTARLRVLVPSGVVSVSAAAEEKGVHIERKSKRQQKRDRVKAKRSSENVCAIVARSGDVSKCPYGESCRFNHDLAGFLAQKPPDLPGKCPFMTCGEHCPYGIACRFSNTHMELKVVEIVKSKKSNSAPNELNSLNKDFQKLLWKNTITFPKADAQLGAMGLLGKAKKLRNSEEDHIVSEQGTTEMAVENSADFTPSHNEASRSLVSIDEEQANSQILSSIPILQEAGLSVSTPDPLTEECPPHKRARTGINSEDLDAMQVSCDCDRTCDGVVGDESKSSSEIGEGKVVNTRENDLHSSVLYMEAKLTPRERKIIDFRGKIYLAPLTTVGNLPFRTVCSSLGADITCGEMAMCTNLLQGQASEWALLRRHSSEKIFGVQVCGSFPDTVARAAELIEQECLVDFIDINVGCPIDIVVNKGAGSCLLTKPTRLEQIVRATSAIMDNPLTLKVRTGYYEGRNCAHSMVPNMSSWGLSAVTVHGRTRQQRYGKIADWSYVQECAAAAKGTIQVIGNGDIFSYTDWTEHLESPGSSLVTCMIARGALIKPWIFTEIKERRHWDISSGERLDILRQYVHSSLGHWGSDSKGVETTRHFLLEWLSYMHRYIPVGVLEVIPQRLNWRPPNYFGRNDLETMMASENASDWVKITELLLGPAPGNFTFTPKHKSNAFDRANNG